MNVKLRITLLLIITFNVVFSQNRDESLEQIMGDSFLKLFYKEGIVEPYKNSGKFTASNFTDDALFVLSFKLKETYNKEDSVEIYNSISSLLDQKSKPKIDFVRYTFSDTPLKTIKKRGKKKRRFYMSISKPVSIMNGQYQMFLSKTYTVYFDKKNECESILCYEQVVLAKVIKGKWRFNTNGLQAYYIEPA